MIRRSESPYFKALEEEGGLNAAKGRNSTMVRQLFQLEKRLNKVEFEASEPSTPDGGGVSPIGRRNSTFITSVETQVHGKKGHNVDP